MARSALGAVAMTWVAYAAVAFASGTWHWVARPWKRREWVAVLLMAIGTSVAIEQLALAGGRWSYASANPIVPGLGVSIVPVLQLLLLLPASFAAAGEVSRRCGRGTALAGTGTSVRRDEHVARRPGSLRALAFGGGDLVFLTAVTAVAAWAMNVGHRPAWSLGMGFLAGMFLAMVAQTALALAVAPILGSIEAMVPSMVSAMAGSTAVCALHLLGRDPTSATALEVGGSVGAAFFFLLQVHGLRYARSLGRRPR